jgi:hypothetical protein
MTSQYGDTRCLLDEQGYMHVRARTPTGTHTHARTQRPVSNTFCFSIATIHGKRASLLRHTYIACLVGPEAYELIHEHSVRASLRTLCVSFTRINVAECDNLCLLRECVCVCVDSVQF